MSGSTEVYTRPVSFGDLPPEVVERLKNLGIDEKQLQERGMKHSLYDFARTPPESVDGLMMLAGSLNLPLNTKNFGMIYKDDSSLLVLYAISEDGRVEVRTKDNLNLNREKIEKYFGINRKR
jgi:hypothetical protein